MNSPRLRTYLIISGVIFALVALGHLLRVLNGWDFVLGPWSLPLWFSWGATLVPAALAVWALRLATTR